MWNVRLYIMDIYDLSDLICTTFSHSVSRLLKLLILPFDTQKNLNFHEVSNLAFVVVSCLWCQINAFVCFCVLLFAYLLVLF